MVFQKKGGAATKRNFSQVKEKVPKKVFEAEEEDDDDDEDMEDDSDLDDSDSDDTDSGDARGKLNAKGKQTPIHGKGLSPLKTTPKGQIQSPGFPVKKNQLSGPAQKQLVMQRQMEFLRMQSQGKGKMVEKQSAEAESDEEDTDDDDDDDLEDDDDTNAGGKVNAKGKQTPNKGKNTSLIKTPKGQAQQTPALASGKKNQLMTPTPKQGKQTPMKGSSQKQTIIKKKEQEDDDDESDDDDEDDDDEDDTDSSEAGGKVNAKGKQTPNQGKSTSLIKTPKGQSPQTPALASGKKNQLMTPTPKQGKQTPMKEFPGMKGSSQKQTITKKEDEEDDDDDSDEEDDDDDDDTSEEEDVKSKTPTALNKSAVKKEPNGKKDMHVSFELPQKAGSPLKAKSQQNTPAQAKKNQQAPTPAKQGKSSQQTPKGNQGKRKAASDDDDEDEDDEDMEEDDEDVDDEESEDDDDESDDDEDEEDDDDDEEDQEAIKKKLASLKKEAMPKKDKKAQNEQNTKLPEPKSKKGKTLLANQKSDDTKQEAKTNNPAQNKAFQKTLDQELQRKRERDARNLFIRGLPLDVTIDEIKALSPDILDVSLPKSKMQKRHPKSLFGFLEFANEKKAEENYIKLQKKKLRGQEIFIDYAGEKSKNKPVANVVNQQNINKKKLYATGLPVDVTMAEVGQLFPRSCVINLNNAPEYRNCNAQFHTEEDAAEAFKANANAKIRGRAINVLYAIEKQNFGNRQFGNRGGFKRPFQGKQNFQSNKKMRMQK